MKQTFILLLFIITCSTVRSQGITLKQIGKPNQYMNIQFADRSNNGTLYTIDFSSGLNKTNLATGEMVKMNSISFKNTRHFFRFRNKLYSIDSDGSMTEIDTATGTWSLRSGLNTWSDIERPIVIGSFFYAIENGAFYRYSAMEPKMRMQIGGSDFYNANSLIETDTTLHCIIRDGSFYQISLRTGEWTRIGKGKSKEWKFAITGEIMNNKLYTIETGGALYETSLPDGTRKLIDANQLLKGRYLIADSGNLYSITSDGYLYQVVFN